MNNNTESCQDLYTVQEINAQPRLWLETFLLLKKNKEDISNYLQPILDINNLRIIVTGAGSSAFIGEAAQSIIQKQTNQLTQPIATTDLVTHPDFFFIKDTPTLLISFAIALSVIGWFLSGQISIGNENSKSESNIQNINENKDSIIENNNSLKVESQLIYAEEIVQSIILQGQTIQIRTIDVKSETTGNIINKNYGVCTFCSHPHYGEKISLDPFELISGKKIQGSWGGGIQPDIDLPKFAKIFRNSP